MDKKLKVLNYLEELEELIDQSSDVPLTGKVMLNRNKVLNLISEITSELPEEYQHVKYLYKNKEEILNEAEQKSERIIDNAEKEKQKVLKELNEKKEQLNQEFNKEHDRLVNKHQIVVDAKKKANEIINDAKQKANSMRNSSFNYSKELLINVHDDMNKQLKTIEKNIRELEDMK